MSEEKQYESPPYAPVNNASPQYASPQYAPEPTTQKMSVNEAIDEFYRLKNNYEITYYDKYVKPIIQKKTSKRDKRVEYSKLPKNECINCKRQVGTIFSISADKDEDGDEIITKKYIAKCGNISDPCPLDIQIQYAVRQQFDITINDVIKTIEKYKLQIIKEKNNALFNNKSASEATRDFENIIDKLKNAKENLDFIVELNMLKNNNPEKKMLLKKSIDEFGRGFIVPFKNMIAKYNETNDIPTLKQAVSFYVEEMVPKLKEIQKLKYSVNTVDYVEFYNDNSSIGDVYMLIQRPNSLEDNEYFIEDDDKVIKFVKGAKQEKTRKNKEKNTNKTRKNKPITNLVLKGDLDNDNAEQNDELPDNKFSRIMINGKQYLKNKSNVLFDISTREKVGIYDRDNNAIQTE